MNNGRQKATEEHDCSKKAETHKNLDGHKMDAQWSTKGRQATWLLKQGRSSQVAPSPRIRCTIVDKRLPRNMIA